MFQSYANTFYNLRRNPCVSSHCHRWVKFVALLLAAMLIIVMLMPNHQMNSRFHGSGYAFSHEIQCPTPYSSIVDTGLATPQTQHQWQSYNQFHQFPTSIASITPCAPPIASKLFNHTCTRTKDHCKVSLALQKQVVASQGWKCVHCQKMLPSTFQTDH